MYSLLTTTHVPYLAASTLLALDGNKNIINALPGTTYDISITGNAGTVTNGVYTTGSYSNPSWITSLSGSKITGPVGSNTLQTDYDNGDGTITTTSGKQLVINCDDDLESPPITSANTNAGWLIQSSGASSDSKNWMFSASSGGNLDGLVINDALTSTTSWMQINRTGMTVNFINFPVGTLQYGGAEVATKSFVNSQLNSFTGTTNIVTVGTISTGTWSGLFGAVSGANLTHLTAANIDAGTAGINISGNASTVTTNANLTGPITSVGNATSVTALAITNAMIANTTIDLTAKVTGILPASNGGTGNAFTAFSGATTSTKTYALPNASATILTTNAAVTAVQGGTNQTTYTLGDTLYSSAANTLSKLAGNTTTAKQYLSQTGTGSASAAPIWSAISGSDVTGAALTKTNDTNVTLTLGGSPNTALLNATSITVGWTGTLAASRIAFNSTNLQNSAGALNTAQDINTGASPTFAGLNITGSGTVGETIKTTTTGGGGEAELTLQRGDNLGYARIRYNTGTTLTFTTGLTNGDNSYRITDQLNSVNLLTLTPAASGSTPLFTCELDQDATTYFAFFNNNNTSSASARLAVGVGGTSASDPYLTYDIFGSYSWSAGVDVSDAGKYKIDYGVTASPGSATKLTIDTSGNVTASTFIGALSGNATTATTATNVAGGGLGSIPYQSSPGSTSLLAGNTTATRKFLRQTGTGTVSAAPVWDILTAADVPGSALTASNDTNVTLTLGGAPSTALLNAASITVGWTGTLAASRIAFNSTNLQNSAGALNTIQDITTSSSPVFTGLTANTLKSNAAQTLALSTPTPASNIDAVGITIIASNGAGSGSSAGGPITITAGNGSGASGANGGSINITTGNGSSGNPPGTLTMKAGTSTTTGGITNIFGGAGANSTAGGGQLNLIAGAAPGQGTGGNAVLTGGAASTFGTAGDVIITGGAAGTSAVAGNVRVRGGIATSGTQGAVIFDQGAVNFNLLTASNILMTDANKNAVSLAVLTPANGGSGNTAAYCANDSFTYSTCGGL